jgi:CDP-glucose 4,6-dehydratase
VDDAVSACLILAAALAEQPELAGEAFNFGQNQPVTVRALVDQILALCGRTDLVPEIRADAKGEIPDQYLDSSRARRLLGWEPQYTLEEGLKGTIAWYRRELGSLAQ